MGRKSQALFFFILIPLTWSETLFAVLLIHTSSRYYQGRSCYILYLSFIRVLILSRVFPSNYLCTYFILMLFTTITTLGFGWDYNFILFISLFLCYYIIFTLHYYFHYYYYIKIFIYIVSVLSILRFTMWLFSFCIIYLWLINIFYLYHYYIIIIVSYYLLYFIYCYIDYFYYHYYYYIIIIPFLYLLVIHCSYYCYYIVALLLHYYIITFLLLY